MGCWHWMGWPLTLTCRRPLSHTPSTLLVALLQETLQWLANPANLNTDLLPPGLESYDPLPFLSSTGRVFLITLLPQVGRRGAEGGRGEHLITLLLKGGSGRFSCASPLHPPAHVYSPPASTLYPPPQPCHERTRC